MALFGVGFVFLIKGADFLIDGASLIAKKFGISAFVVGLTIVAFGTSVPELVVNISASLHGSSDIAIGNILGSNIANIFLVLGVSAVMIPVVVKRRVMQKEIPISLLAILVMAFIANDSLVDPGETSMISRDDGIILIAFFMFFLYYVYTIARKGKPKKEVEQFGHEKFALSDGLKPFLYIIIGLAGLVLGGDWVINGAISIASYAGVSESLIGLTILAIGTSLPELVTTVVAVGKKKSDIAVGNIIGSNIFNIFWILGVSAIILPIPFDASMNFEVLTVVLATSLMIVFLKYVGEKYQINKWQGMVFLTFYTIFLLLIIMRG